jgi:hypothetical protein
MMFSVRRKVSAALDVLYCIRVYGVTCQMESFQPFCDSSFYLRFSRPTSDPSGSLDLVVSAIQERIDKQSLRTTIVDVDAITSVVADLSSSDEDLAQESIQLFDAFNAQKLYFDEKLKSHRLIAPAAYHLLSSSEMRADMYRQRLLFTQQRLLRSERFALKGMGTSSS